MTRTENDLGRQRHDVRLLAARDAEALCDFYNTLSPATIRLFRPLGLRTSRKRCRRVLAEGAESPPSRIDWVIPRSDEAAIAGWVFIEHLQGPHPDLGIAVADDLQGLGLGATLLAHALEKAREHGLDAVHLTVVGDNERAIALYRRNGFEVIGTHFNEHDGLTYSR